jgi:hypothetical protein
VENSAQNGRAILSKESFLHFHLKSSFKAGFVVAILKVQKWFVVHVLDFLIESRCRYFDIFGLATVSATFSIN